MNIAGLWRLQLVLAGREEGLSQRSRESGRVNSPCAPVAKVERVDHSADVGGESLGDREGRVTLCRPLQPAMLLTSSTRGAPSASAIRSTPAKTAPSAVAARSADFAPRRAKASTATGFAPWRTLVIHCCERRRIAPTISPRRNQHAHVLEARAPATAADEALQIIDAARVLQATAARSSLRMSCRPQPCAPNSGFSTSGPCGHSRRTMARACASGLRDEGRRRRQSRAGQQKARHGFVGAALDGARVVDHRHAERRQRVQHAEPHGDRLERAVADGAHDAEIGQRRRNPGMARP